MARSIRPGGTTDGADLIRAASGEDVNNLQEAVARLLEVREAEAENLNEVDDYMRGKQRRPYQPREASREYKELADRAVTNIMPLVISNMAQLLYVEDYLPATEGSATEEALDARPVAWSVWQEQRMDLRQAKLYRAALTYGISYATITSPYGAPVIRAVSPRRMVTLYDDPVNDEWPVYALELVSAKRRTFTLYDAENTYLVRLTGDEGSRTVEIGPGTPHRAPVCPVVRFAHNLDIEGRYVGEVEPLIPSQDRLNQTVMDRLLVQTFGSWKIRTISGMAQPASQEAAESLKVKMGVDRMLIADDPDTKFGSLPETQLSGFIQAASTDQEILAALASVPPHYLTGSLNNLGAEAIAEARASLEAKVTECKHAFGESVEQVLRLCAYFSGDVEGWQDYSAQVVWHDAQNRSLSQVADALGKISSMLAVPPQALWNRLPGVTRADTERWRAMAEDSDFTSLLREVQGGGGGDPEPIDPETPAASDDGS